MVLSIPVTKENGRVWAQPYQRGKWQNLNIVVTWGLPPDWHPVLLSLHSGCCWCPSFPVSLPWPVHHPQQTHPVDGNFLSPEIAVSTLMFTCVNKTVDLDSVFFTMLSSQTMRRGMIYYQLVNLPQLNHQSRKSILGNSVFVGWLFLIFFPLLLLPKMPLISEATSDSSIQKSYYHHCVPKARRSWCQEGWVMLGVLMFLGFFSKTGCYTQPSKGLWLQDGHLVPVFFPTTICQV